MTDSMNGLVEFCFPVYVVLHALAYVFFIVRLHYLCLPFLAGAYQQLTGFAIQRNLQNSIV